MLVYRVAHYKEVQNILLFKSFRFVGDYEREYNKSNTHYYEWNKRYLHFFDNLDNINYLHLNEGNCVCTYDIPEDILDKHRGHGIYMDYINFEHAVFVDEYAVPTSKLKYEYLVDIKQLLDCVDYEDYIENGICNIKLLYKKK